MRSHFGWVFVVCAGLACAQTDQDLEILRAKAGINKLRALVEAGAAPRAQLDRAEQAIADAEDAAFLKHTLYGNDLTEAQTAPMIEAAGRRLERRKQELEHAKRMVA